MTVEETHVALDLTAVDEGIPARTDFYRHVNGSWLDSATIPDDKPLTGAFSDLRDRSEEAVRDLVTGLGTPAPHEGPQTDTDRIAGLYASFMDTETIERLGAAPLGSELAAVEAVEDVAGLVSLLGANARGGLGSLLYGGVDADPGAPEQYALFISQGGLGLPDEEYYRLEQYADIRAAYVAHMERMFALAGLEDPAGQAAAVMALETGIAACHWDKVRRRDMVASYNPITIDELVRRVGAINPAVDLSRWFEGLGVDLAKVTKVIESQPSFLDEVAPLLATDRLPQWRSWARWRVLNGTASYLSDDFVLEHFGFYGTTLSGTPTIKPRWKRGVGLVEGCVGEAVGRLYVDAYFPPAAKERCDELVANLLEAYRRSISSLEWMTEATRTEALSKLAKFTPKIGYPGKWIDYSKLEIRPDDLVGNVRRTAEFDTDRDLAKVGGPIDPDEWFMTPQTVNAYYHPLRNEIVFPAAILQPPFFDPEADDAVNFGGIGAVIGHEIGHGFDDQGSTADGDGRLRNWWTDADRTAFEERTKALIAQYDGLVPEGADGQSVNGALTIGENIGDLGGASIAYDAWRIALASPETGETIEPEPIDGLSGAQRFFMNFARIWQQKTRPETVRQRLATDPHSPSEFRCNQTLKNLDAFHETFGTQEGDGMWLAPQERVHIW
ncbi:endothelin-converting enzyme Metallo peptidase. MEROPS family M13 [Raineyella antarctica]|uniref:Endothelin-converting enzyme Metallo peptidase. MEROPS family M13 n=1 Tax=Raineyella antarctica TaxID=1577474 RepID=A0A1G6GFB5_9ACTN|nr:M13-type metalloendopeptidase [Raineyella antarctica]SDB80701.1 endothelin-converting enzyme Metallo peptidase. MEROPS family M13 [Raineyella antarctica]